MARSVAIAGLVLAAVLSAPIAVSACVVSLPPSAEELGRDAEREGQAWTTASSVYEAEITAVGLNYEVFELTPRRILKGRGPVPVLDVPAVPVRGMCVRYHGLNGFHGAALGDTFIVYALSDPPDISHLHVVSARMLGDPTTRSASARARRQGR